MDFFVYEAVKVLVARWGDEAARSANTPADRSKRATQLSPGAALPALCLLSSVRLDFPLAPGRFVLAEVSVLAGLLIFWVPLLAAGLFFVQVCLVSLKFWRLSTLLFCKWLKFKCLVF